MGFCGGRFEILGCYGGRGLVVVSLWVWWIVGVASGSSIPLLKPGSMLVVSAVGNILDHPIILASPNLGPRQKIRRISQKFH